MYVRRPALLDMAREADPAMSRFTVRRCAVMASVAVAFLAVAMAVSIAIGQDAPVERFYEGTVGADPSVPIQVRLNVEDGQGQNAVVRAQNVPVRCAGETVETRNLILSDATFLSNRIFEGRAYNPPPPGSGARQLFKVRGRLIGGGRARGFLFYFDTRCSTDGLLRWIAERTP